MTVVRKRYHEIKDEWFGKPEVFDRQDVIEVILVVFLVSSRTINWTAVIGTPSHRC